MSTNNMETTNIPGYYDDLCYAVSVIKDVLGRIDSDQIARDDANKLAELTGILAEAKRDFNHH